MNPTPALQAYVLKNQQLVGTIVDALEEVKLPSGKSYLAALVDVPTRDELVRGPVSARHGCPLRVHLSRWVMEWV